MLNSRQFDRRLEATRNAAFCNWLPHLAAEDEVSAEQEPLNEEKEAAASANIAEFEHVDKSNSLDDIPDEAIFDGVVDH